MKIKLETCEFVCVSDLFEDHRETWNTFVEGSPPFTWGDNNRSLVTVEAILDHIDGTFDEDCPESLRQLCVEVGLQTYVDLEN